MYEDEINKAWWSVNRSVPMKTVELQFYQVYRGRYSYDQMVENMINGDICENKVRPVCRLYQVILSRKPDHTGLDYHVSNFNNYLAQTGNNRQLSLEYLAPQFMSAPEFQAVYPNGGSDDQFITALYNNALRRQPEPGAVDYWKNRMASGQTRAQVVIAFSESSEFITNTFPTISDMLRRVAHDDPNAYVGSLA